MDKPTKKNPSTRVPFTAEERAAFDAKMVREAGPRIEAERRIHVLVGLLGEAAKQIELGRNESFWFDKVARLWLAAAGGQDHEKRERAIVMRWIQHGADLEDHRAWFRNLPAEVQRDVQRGFPESEPAKAVWPKYLDRAASGFPFDALETAEPPAEFVQRRIANALVMRMLEVRTPVAREQIAELLAVWKRQRGNGPVQNGPIGKWELLAAFLKTLRFLPVGVEALKSEWTRIKKSSGQRSHP